MTATMYITRTGDMIEFGKPARVTLYEFPDVSRVWMRRVEVEMPDGFEVGQNMHDRPMICRAGETYELIANAKGIPCIIDHTDFGRYIPLKILSEGWDEQ